MIDTEKAHIIDVMVIEIEIVPEIEIRVTIVVGIETIHGPDLIVIEIVIIVEIAVEKTATPLNEQATDLKCSRRSLLMIRRLLRNL